MAYLHVGIHVAFVLLLPPLSLGVINKTKALFAGRVGPPLLQPYYDLAKLFRKNMVRSRTTSWVFIAGPVAGLVTTFLAALIVPLGAHAAPLSFAGDFVLFAYVLGLGRFFTMAAAFDTGSAFGGMGGARVATFSSLAEPTLFFGFLVLAHATGSYSVSTLLGPALSAAWAPAGPSLVAIGVSWFVILLAENSRIPFDDPNTHLEVTMTHEVMVLDHSGPALGLIGYGAAMKLFVFCALVLGIIVPLHSIGPWLSWGVFVSATLALAVLVGAIESTMARLRLALVPRVLVAACLISAFGAVLLVR